MRIGMLLAPSEQTVYTGLTLPPNTLGVMTSYLRQEGHRVRQYDLDTDLLDLYEAGALAKEDLRRFKQLMEAGEIATVDGQPSGRAVLPS